MKKLFLMVVCAMMAFGVSAQSNFSFGVKAGGNFSGLWGDDAKGSEGKFGYQAGLTAEYKFTNDFAIAPEVMFSSQGFKATADVPFFGKQSSCIYMNNIAVPVMLKYYTGENFSLNFGPQFDFNVYDKVKGEDIKDACNDFNFAIAIGASYYFDSNFYVDARYSMGVTNLFKDVASVKSDAKSYNVALSLGYKF